MWSFKTSSLSWQQTNERDLTNMKLIPEGQEVHALHWPTQPLGPAPDTLPPKYLALKSSRSYVQENHRTVKNEDFTFKGL